MSRGAKKHILVVDDNEDAGQLMVALTESWGHEAEHVSDGPTAIARVTELVPDVVLLDLSLPGMDGYEIATRLRGDVGFGGAIVAVSGYVVDPDRPDARDALFDHRLVKPVDMEALRKTLSR